MPSAKMNPKVFEFSPRLADVGVGLLSQPLYMSLLVMWLQQGNPGCNTHKALFIVSSFFCIASFFGVVALSVDRFLAIHLHLRYRELVTHKRVVSVVILIWVLTGFIFFHDLVGFIRYYPLCCGNSCSCLSPCYSCGLYQDLFGRTTPPQKSGSCSARTTSNRE